MGAIQSRQSLGSLAEALRCAIDPADMNKGKYLVAGKGDPDAEIDGIAGHKAPLRLFVSGKNYGMRDALASVAGDRHEHYAAARRALKQLVSGALHAGVIKNEKQASAITNLMQVLATSKSTGRIKIDDIQNDLATVLDAVETADRQAAREVVKKDCHVADGKVAHFFEELRERQTSPVHVPHRFDDNEKFKITGNKEVWNRIISMNSQAKQIKDPSTVSRFRTRARSFSKSEKASSGQSVNLLYKISDWPGQYFSLALEEFFKAADGQNLDAFNEASDELRKKIAEAESVLELTRDVLNSEAFINSIENPEDRAKLNLLCGTAIRLLANIGDPDSAFARLKNLAVVAHKSPEETCRAIADERRKSLLSPIPTTPAPPIPLPLVDGLPGLDIDPAADGIPLPPVELMPEVMMVPGPNGGQMPYNPAQKVVAPPVPLVLGAEPINMPGDGVATQGTGADAGGGVASNTVPQKGAAAKSPRPLPIPPAEPMSMGDKSPGNLVAKRVIEMERRLAKTAGSSATSTYVAQPSIPTVASPGDAMPPANDDPPPPQPTLVPGAAANGGVPLANLPPLPGSPPPVLPINPVSATALGEQNPPAPDDDPPPPQPTLVPGAAANGGVPLANLPPLPGSPPPVLPINPVSATALGEQNPPAPDDEPPPPQPTLVPGAAANGGVPLANMPPVLPINPAPASGAENQNPPPPTDMPPLPTDALPGAPSLARQQMQQMTELDIMQSIAEMNRTGGVLYASKKPSAAGPNAINKAKALKNRMAAKVATAADTLKERMNNFRSGERDRVNKFDQRLITNAKMNENIALVASDIAASKPENVNRLMIRQDRIVDLYVQAMEAATPAPEKAIRDFIAADGGDLKQSEKYIKLGDGDERKEKTRKIHFFRRLNDAAQARMGSGLQEKLPETQRSNELINKINESLKLSGEIQALLPRVFPDYFNVTLDFFSRTGVEKIRPQNIAPQEIFSMLMSRFVSKVCLVMDAFFDQLESGKNFDKAAKEMQDKMEVGLNILLFVTRLLTDVQYVQLFPDEIRPSVREFGELLQDLSLDLLDPESPFMAAYRLSQAAQVYPEEVMLQLTESMKPQPVQTA
ncbi:hypothetical protein GCM10023165_19100 [Variovorax defluvii]|uniref:Uncharacterized protein n=1 Tax=Variovorax defluvii TaxID=913761 RepID=A0ABP8HII3_9BURK